jgi:hypothetical protein
MATSLKWFGIRIGLRTVAGGRAVKRDVDYDAAGTLFEERIVVVRARNARDAFARVRRRVQREAITFKNAYGQVVRQELLPEWESYELFDPPSDGAEVFSRTTRVPATVRDRDLTARFVDSSLSGAEQRKRRRFIAADVAEGLDALWGRRLTSR